MTTSRRAVAQPGVFSGMLDAEERVMGQVPYTLNVELPGMLHAKLLRSTSPHARLAHVDVERARHVTGVAAVLTGADLANRSDLFPYFGPVFRDQPLLAVDKVRYVGDPVVAVAAVDLDAADEALSLVQVEYDDLPAVFSTEDAIAPGAPLLHEGPPRGGATFADVVLNATGESNVCNHFKLRKGDVEQGFAKAEHVFEDIFTSPAVSHVPFETHVCVAHIENGRLIVWATTQTPHNLRAQLADVFRLPLAQVRVIVPTLGGGYGAKCYPKTEPITAALAQVTRRPVKMVLTREEQTGLITKHAVRMTMKTGLTRDGNIVARKSTCYFNTGAYADIGPRLIKNGGYGTGGPHAIPHVWVDAYCVYTNLPPAGAFRGYGISQAAWAYETQMDMIAARLGMDPLELRMKNLLQDGDTFATGEVVHDCHFRELLQDAATRIVWDGQAAPVRQGSKVRAKGLSCIIKGTIAPSTSTATVKLNEDGSVNVLTSSVEMGQGLLTAMAVIAAEKLGIPPTQVRVSGVDTDVTPYDQQTSSSRSTQAMGAAVGFAMDDVRAQVIRHASELLEVGREDLEIAAGRVQVRGAPDRSLDVGDVVRKTRSGNILGHGTYKSEGGLDPEIGQGTASVHWHQAAGAAEVEVDLETGQVNVLQYHGNVYAGRMINPVQCELQTEGSVAFGLGQALFEEMLYDAGQLQNANLGDYMVPSMRDLPSALSVSVLEHLEANEIHGIGETSLPPVMPAIGNAVYRATGVRITDLPITPEKVLRALRSRGDAPGRDGPNGALSGRSQPAPSRTFGN
ncbi:MAG TPA: xanthine dehydrogenase family protein molybdopterin-binding subunit [Chloroflexota bacterium]|nr:xanthine dehydrogenase family protein molybdopterin-binding subunit [Chloroflexota bacterium]